MKIVQLFAVVGCLSVLALAGCSDKQCSTYNTQADCTANKYNSTTCVWNAAASCSGTVTSSGAACMLNTAGTNCCAVTNNSCTTNEIGCTTVAACQ